MIWLYLFALLVASLGVGVVALDWFRGIRRGILVPLVVFSVAAYVAVNVISWIAVVDAGRDVRTAEVVTTDEGEVSVEMGRRGSTSIPAETRSPWWSLKGWPRADYLALANLVMASLSPLVMLLGLRRRAEKARRRQAGHRALGTPRVK